MDTANWFSQAIQNSSSVNTPPRSSTPRGTPSRTGGGLGLASRRAGGSGLGDSQEGRSGSGGGGPVVDQALLNESISLGKRYQDEYSVGGAAKKMAVANASGSPVGSPAGNVGASTSPGTTYMQPSRLGASSLYNVSADQLATRHAHSPATPLRTSRLSRIHNPRAHRAHGYGLGLSSSASSSALAQSAGGGSGSSGAGGGAGGTSPSHAFATPTLGRKRSNTAGSAQGSDGSPGQHSGGLGLGGGSGEDDRPPTVSLMTMGSGREEERRAGGGDVSGSSVGSGSGLASIDRSTPAPRPTSSLLILGVPHPYLAQLESFLAQYGPLTFTPGPPGSNYATAAFESEVVAMRLLRQSGTLRFGGYLLGVVPQYDAKGVPLGVGADAGAGTGAGGGLAPPTGRNALQRSPSGASQSSAPAPAPVSGSGAGAPTTDDIPATRILPQARADVYKPRAETPGKKTSVPPEFAFELGDGAQSGTPGQGQQAQQAGQPSWVGGVLRNVGSSLGEILFGR